MQRSHSLTIIVGLLTCGGPARLPESRHLDVCRIERISDGDSFTCAGRGRIRLIGMDSPELGQGELGRRSREELLRLVDVGSEVRLETDVRPIDRYGRTLAYVWRDSVMLNREMIRRGWALLYTVPPNVKYVELFRSAQDSAQAEGAGHWASDGFACTPVRHRRREC